MAKALVLGNKSFSTNIIQGPLAGISSAPFRALVSHYGRPAFSYTEMISCKTLIHHPKHSLPHFLRKMPGEGPLGVQLSGTCPKELALAVKIAEDSGADLIDLNCGCPVKKIRRRGAGSALLAEPGKLHQLIAAMKNNTSLPVSIKIRIDGNEDDNLNQKIAETVNNSGLDFLIVHGRHWQEDYTVPCHYDQIRFFVENITLPVIGNGDIACQNSLKKMLATGCSGVMVSRASVGQPWLIRQLTADTSLAEPTPEESARIFCLHTLLLARFHRSEQSALLQARRFSKYYARHLQGEDLHFFCQGVIACRTLSQLKTLTKKYFGVI